MKRHSRRLFLRSAAASVALPWLASALPRAARGSDPKPPVRLFFFYVPCGIQDRNWTPATEGLGWAPTPLLAPLGDLAAQTCVLTGLDNRAAENDGIVGDHARGTGSFLTCTPIGYTGGADLDNGISVDQIAATARGGETPFASLQLGLEAGGNTGQCNAGYSCAYSRNLAWAGPATPLPNITDAQVLFDRLFGGVDPELSAAESARRTALRASVLDTVTRQANDLDRRLGRDDQLKLDEYLTAVRDLETRIQGLGTGACEAPAPPAVGGDFEAQVQAMLDLAALSWQCDLTRITTFMLANSATNRSYDFLGVLGAHHQLSHHQGVEATIAKLEVIDTWEVAQFAYLARQLSQRTESDGSSILDNSLLYFSSEIRDGDAHDHRNLPTLLAGGGGGRVVPGRHLVYDGAPVADLFLAMLDAFGAPQAAFGLDGTAPLAGLLTP